MTMGFIKQELDSRDEMVHSVNSELYMDRIFRSPYNPDRSSISRSQRDEWESKTSLKNMVVRIFERVAYRFHYDRVEVSGEDWHQGSKGYIIDRVITGGPPTKSFPLTVVLAKKETRLSIKVFFENDGLHIQRKKGGSVSITNMGMEALHQLMLDIRTNELK